MEGTETPILPAVGAPALTHDQVEAVEGSPIAVTPNTEPIQEGHSRLGPLRHKAFRNVWLGAFGSSIGGWMEQIGVQWVVAHESERPMVAMGWLTAAHLGPSFVLGLYGGLLADRINRKKLLLVTQAILMVIAASIAAVSYYHPTNPPIHVGPFLIDTPKVLTFAMLLYGITMAFNIPAWQVLTPRLVPRSELTEAIALNGLQFNLARVLGPALAGILLAGYGATVLFVINTISFIGVLAAVAFTPDSPAPPQQNTSPWHQTREALSFVFHHPGPRAAFVAMVVFSLLAVPLLRMLPVFITDVFHTKEQAFGWMTAAMGAGAVAGVFGLRRVPRWYPKHHLIPLSVLGCGLAITVFCSSTIIAIAYVAMFFAGVFWLWTFNTSFSAMQLLVADGMRGRVLAVCNVAVFGAMPVGSMLAGYIGEYVSKIAGPGKEGLGTQIGVGSLAVILAVCGTVMLIWRTPEVDGIGPGEQGYDRRPGLLRGLTGSAHRPRA